MIVFVPFGVALFRFAVLGQQHFIAVVALDRVTFPMYETVHETPRGVIAPVFAGMDVSRCRLNSQAVVAQRATVAHESVNLIAARPCERSY